MAIEGERAVVVSVGGTVQGVGFRAWTKEEADALGVRGWVRNEADGTVSAMLEGSDEAVQAMVCKLLEGPASAEVGDVSTKEGAPSGMDGFTIRD